MTSPVDFISGPSTGSTPGKRRKGKTGALTNTPGTCGSSTKPMASRVSPAIPPPAPPPSRPPHGLAAVGDHVEVHLESVLEEAVEQHRMPGRHLSRLAHVALEGRGVIADGHGASAEDIARAHQHREADAVRHLDRL